MVFSLCDPEFSADTLAMQRHLLPAYDAYSQMQDNPTGWALRQHELETL
jgi:hypothetical protein